MYLVANGDHGTSVSDKIVQKTKNVVDTRFFLRIFSPAHLDHRIHSEKFSGGWVGGIAIIESSIWSRLSYLR